MDHPWWRWRGKVLPRWAQSEDEDAKPNDDEKFRDDVPKSNVAVQPLCNRSVARLKSDDDGEKYNDDSASPALIKQRLMPMKQALQKSEYEGVWTMIQKDRSQDACWKMMIVAPNTVLVSC